MEIELTPAHPWVINPLSQVNPCTPMGPVSLESITPAHPWVQLELASHWLGKSLPHTHK